MYLAELRPDASQGDIFESVSLLSIAELATTSDLSLQLHKGHVILITHDCEYDKPANSSVLFAEIRSLSEIALGSQGHIRQYRTRNTFYLEIIESYLPESYVDFRRITRLPKTVISKSWHCKRGKTAKSSTSVSITTRLS